ncbi:MAG: GNAT family N-acetyltransferase [Gammaproteobacteria bacterium]
MLASSFQSSRLVARLPLPSDSARIFSAYASKPEVSRFMMWRPHKDISETDDFVSECIAAVRAGTRYPYVLTERANPGVLIGMLEARPSGHTVDIGYVLAPEYWGRGYMPEAVATLAEHALGEAGFFRVQAFCDVQNIPSQRTLEKAGFAREGRHDRFVVHPNLSEEPRPCFMYARCR